jgi:hypothetical protein
MHVASLPAGTADLTDEAELESGRKLEWGGGWSGRAVGLKRHGARQVVTD